MPNEIRDVLILSKRHYFAPCMTRSGRLSKPPPDPFPDASCIIGMGSINEKYLDKSWFSHVKARQGSASSIDAERTFISKSNKKGVMPKLNVEGIILPFDDIGHYKPRTSNKNRSPTYPSSLSGDTNIKTGKTTPSNGNCNPVRRLHFNNSSCSSGLTPDLKSIRGSQNKYNRNEVNAEPKVPSILKSGSSSRSAVTPERFPTLLQPMNLVIPSFNDVHALGDNEQEENDVNVGLDKELLSMVHTAERRATSVVTSTHSVPTLSPPLFSSSKHDDAQTIGVARNKDLNITTTTNIIMGTQVNSDNPSVSSDHLNQQDESSDNVPLDQTNVKVIRATQKKKLKKTSIGILPVFDTKNHQNNISKPNMCESVKKIKPSLFAYSDNLFSFVSSDEEDELKIKDTPKTTFPVVRLSKSQSNTSMCRQSAAEAHISAQSLVPSSLISCNILPAIKSLEFDRSGTMEQPMLTDKAPSIKLPIVQAIPIDDDCAYAIDVQTPSSSKSSDTFPIINSQELDRLNRAVSTRKAPSLRSSTFRSSVSSGYRGSKCRYDLMESPCTSSALSYKTAAAGSSSQKTVDKLSSTSNQSQKADLKKDVFDFLAYNEDGDSKSDSVGCSKSKKKKIDLIRSMKSRSPAVVNGPVPQNDVFKSPDIFSKPPRHSVTYSTLLRKYSHIYKPWSQKEVSRLETAMRAKRPRNDSDWEQIEKSIPNHNLTDCKEYAVRFLKHNSDDQMNESVVNSPDYDGDCSSQYPETESLLAAQHYTDEVKGVENQHLVTSQSVGTERNYGPFIEYLAESALTAMARMDREVEESFLREDEERLMKRKTKKATLRR